MSFMGCPVSTIRRAAPEPRTWQYLGANLGTENVTFEILKYIQRINRLCWRMCPPPYPLIIPSGTASGTATTVRTIWHVADFMKAGPLWLIKLSQTRRDHGH